MRKRSIGFIAVTLLSSYACADDSIFTSQAFVSNNAPNQSVTNRTELSSETIDWRTLCANNESRLEIDGCSPDCNSAAMAPACLKLFKNSQIEKFSLVPLPYDSNGVFVFRINDNLVAKTANFSVLVNSVPQTGNGYVCELVYKDGRPAELFNTTFFGKLSVIAVDYHCTPASGHTCKSNNYADYMSQSNTSAPTYAWYKNPNQPIYMLCLSYIEVDSNPTHLQSISGCAGTSGDCVSYVLQ